MIDVEKLREMTRQIFDDAIERLRETGDCRMMLVVVTADEGREMILCDGPLTNSPAAKRTLGDSIRARAARGEVQAVLLLSDTFFDDRITPENNAIRQRLRLNIEQAAELGLCEKREAIMAKIETPIYAEIMQQEYRRDPRDGRRIELVGERRVHPCEARPSSLSGFFPAAAKATKA